MRINKYIASSGICSRRKAEELINKGLVTVNEQVVGLSFEVLENDVVKIDGQIIKNKSDFVVLLFNKPRGVTCTTDLKDKDNIIDYLKYPERIFPIGRLDKDSQGLILLTNNGDLVNKCLRVENHHEKEYEVKVDRKITDSFLDEMKQGVNIYNPVNNSYVKTLPCKITKIGSNTFKIILTQGLNRQIRRMCTALGYHVVSLRRIRFMSLHLDVKEGKYRQLTEKEISSLLNI